MRKLDLKLGDTLYVINVKNWKKKFWTIIWKFHTEIPWSSKIFKSILSIYEWFNQIIFLFTYY